MSHQSTIVLCHVTACDVDTMKILNPEDENSGKKLKFNHFPPTIKSNRC